MIGITLAQVKASSTSENIQEKEPTIFLFFCTDQKKNIAKEYITT